MAYCVAWHTAWHGILRGMAYCVAYCVTTVYIHDSVRICVLHVSQPLKTPNLTEAGVPAWAAELIRSVPMGELLDLAEAATTLGIKMYVQKMLF